MSQSGKLTFYTTDGLDDPRASIRAVVDYLDPKCISVISRGLKEAHSWENFLAGRDDPKLDMLPSLASPDDLESYYLDGSVLSAQPDGSQIGFTIAQAVETKIPVEIRGEFIPSDPVVCIGWHDIWESAEHDEGLFIARAFFSIGFFGYSTPNDWKAFRERVFELMEVQDVKLDLQRLIGHPLEQVIYWHA
ncbi:MAG TPA: hypothetical protein VHD56_01110 [Tepidisphaeraceae bacterium]|nr:hypothetical protein [Tepidisphaeraceae bacterium]